MRARHGRAPRSEMMMEYIDIVFDGPPGPESGRFVEVENAAAESIKCGEWRPRARWLLGDSHSKQGHSNAPPKSQAQSRKDRVFHSGATRASVVKFPTFPSATARSRAGSRSPAEAARRIRLASATL